MFLWNNHIKRIIFCVLVFWLLNPLSIPRCRILCISNMFIFMLYQNTSESVTAINATSSVPSSAQTYSSSTSQSPSHKSSVSSRRSTIHSRSSPKKRSSSRTRSISRRRSSSRTRSPSRGRSSRQESPSHSALTVASRSGRGYSRPSSHIVSVSHV